MERKKRRLAAFEKTAGAVDKHTLMAYSRKGTLMA